MLASALAVGSVVTWALCLVTAALAGAVFLLWYGSEPSRARPAAGIIVGVGVLLTAYTLLQCLPLPASFLGTIAPESADVWARALHPLGEAGPASATISVEPLATRIQVLRGIAYLLAFVAAMRVAQRREGTAFLLNAVVVCSAVLAVTALLHPALGAEKVFWLYAPSDSGAIETRHIAPLVNANHLAAYVTIGLCVALGNAIVPTPPLPRILSVTAFLFLLGVELWIASRGGLLGVVLGALITVGMTLAIQRGGRAATVGGIAVGASIAMSLALLVLAGSSRAWEELSDTDVSKVSMAREGLRLVSRFPTLGAGRGAFEVAFPSVRTTPGYFVFTHPENIAVQWVTEWGVPVALVAAVALLYALRPSTALARSRPPIGAWAALVAVAVHDLVDFSMEVPGVVLLLAVCAGTVAGGTAGSGTASILSTWSRRTGAIAVGALGIAAAGIALVIPGMGHELREDRGAMHARVVQAGIARSAFVPLEREALLRHPSEPYFPFVGAVRAAQARDESIVPWIGRTLERAPVYGPAHLLLARSLYSRSPSQARLEYRLALAQDPSTGGAFLKEAPPLVRSFDDAMELVPAEGEMRTSALQLLVDPVAARLPAAAVRLDELLLKNAPTAIEPMRRRAAAGISDLRAEEAAPWCAADRAACVAKALDAANALRNARPGMCEGAIARSAVLVEAGETPKALGELEEASERAQDWTNCTHALVDVASRAHDDARVSAALERLIRGGCATDEECVSNLSYVAGVELGRANPSRALSAYKMAYARSPSDDLLVAEVELAARIGLHAEALKGYEQLAQKHPENARWQSEIAAERQAVGRALAH